MNGTGTTIDPRHLQNGAGSQTNSLTPTVRTSHQPRLTLPSVNEALPYTPFSSIVPFNPDIVPPPLAFPTTTPTAFGNDENVKSVRRELERLTAGAARADQASNRCKQTLEDVRRFLDAENITEFKFKDSKRSRKSDASRAPLQTPALSPFARMVYESTHLMYRTSEPTKEPDSRPKPAVQPGSQSRAVLGPAPNTAQARSQHRVVLGPAPTLGASQQESLNAPPQQQTVESVALFSAIPRLSQSSQPQYSPQAQNGYQQNLHIPVTKHISPQPATPGVPKKLFVQPASLTSTQLAHFQRVNDGLSEEGAPSGNRNAHLTSRASTDQRLKGDTAVNALQSQIQAIFEAEDHMQPDTSEDVPMQNNELLTISDTGEGPALVLQSRALLELESNLLKTVNLGRLDDIEVEQLTRIQRICERSLATLGSLSLTITSEMSEQDVQEWLEHVDTAENSLVAARTLLFIMTGGSEHKELQSEDCLRNVLDCMRNIVETCIIPITEERSYLGEKIRGEKETPSNPKFIVAYENRTQLQSLMQAAAKCLRLLGRMFMIVEVDESGISSLEYLCKTLIFAENATNDRDAALGTRTFDTIRRHAMDVMAKMFTKYPSQRSFIFDEILLSLEKLPANKQSARQYPINGAKNVQLVSALLLRLVQTSATPDEKALRPQVKNDLPDDDEDEESEVSDSEDDSDEDEIQLGSVRIKKGKRPTGSTKDFAGIWSPLQASAVQNAKHVVGMLLRRALGTSKNSEEPFRKLLDIFTDDFINCLGHSDWPAAEILLRALAHHLIGTAENAKSPAPSRTLALELLGVIGSGVIDVQSATIEASKGLDGDISISTCLVDLARQLESETLISRDVIGFEGPYRVVVEYLHARGFDEKKDPVLITAHGYHLVQWAQLACDANNMYGGDDGKAKTLSIQANVRCQMEDVNWLEDNFQFPTPNTAQGKLAAKLVTVGSPLFQLFDRMFTVILSSMRSEQPTVRSRSLKSVTTLLERDPTILDRKAVVLTRILQSLGDTSSLVRDSALNLIQKCVALRPSLELKVYERVVERTHDTSPGVRKRAMAFLKQAYLRSNDNELRASISNALMLRYHDVDDGVKEFARANIEEIWFTAFKYIKSADELSVDARLQLASHAALIIQTVDSGDNVYANLEILVKTILVHSKQATDNARVCKALVKILFEGIVDSGDIPGHPAQGLILRTLMIFAKAGPRLFTSSQIELLEPYTKNLLTSDDLETFHFVITILRFTMPVLSGIRHEFLHNLQFELLKCVNKVGKSELSAVAPCLWTIDSIIGNTERLVKFLSSAMQNVISPKNSDLNDPNTVRVVCKLLAVVGQLGKACNLDAHLATFKRIPQFSAYKGDSVAGLMAEICCKFTSPKHPVTVREAALEAVCAIGQSYSKCFLRSDVTKAFELVFEEKESRLEQCLLFNLSDFFQSGETVEDDPAAPSLGSGPVSGTQRLGGTYQATGNDVALASLSQRFLPQFLRIALSSLDEVALSAARIVASIHRQGVAHPGESAPSLAALETCPNTSIAKIAFLAHKDCWSKHEGVLEKTLLKSVQQSFEYQQNIVQSATGFTGHPPTSKLHYFWEVLKSSPKSKPRMKFFSNICASLDFDPVKMNSSDNLHQHLLYVRFCGEAIAFLDYNSIPELMHLLLGLEKTFASTGTVIAQSIESEILKIQVPTSQHVISSQPMLNGDSESFSIPYPTTPNIDAARLQQLAISAQIFSVLWETRSYIKRLWKLDSHVGKKPGSKEQQKTATRATTAPALTEAYQARIEKLMDGTADEDSQQGMCRSFVELISTDHDVKVADGDADAEGELDDDGDEVRSESSGGRNSKSPGRPRGKKRKSDGGGGPSKKKGRTRKGSLAKMYDEDDEDDEEDGWD